jgi:CDP-diacylglycerol--glycerol-3-phosphate 3-phosphatidyltransferase
MLSNKLKHRLDKPLTPLIRFLAAFGVSPNMLTVAGAIMNIAAAVMLVYGHLLIGGILVLIGGMFDLLDGALARVVSKQSRFGTILDSTLDRYSDAAPILGLLLHYSGWSPYFAIEPANMVLCGVVMIGSLLVPYVRARAESQGQVCDMGFAERAERVIIFAGGLILGIEVAALWALAILTHFTVIQRLLFVHAQLREGQEELDTSHPDREELIAQKAESDIS